MKKVSINDIARKAGVSVSTVSFVMNDKAVRMRISRAVIEKVEQVAREMGYRPNQLARGLRTGRTRTIGLIVENISNPFFSVLAKTIEDEAKKYDYKVVYCSTDNDDEKARDLIFMLSQRQVDGYIITPTPNLGEDIIRLQAENKPVILIDRYFPQYKEIPSVLVDNYSGVIHGMESLISSGHHKIALVTIQSDMAHMKDRIRAYYDALNAHQIPVNEQLLKMIPYNSDKEIALQEISDLFRRSPDQVDAVFFLTNYLGLLGMEVIKSLRIRVPDDMAVLCFDDNDVFRLYTPSISVIRQPIAEIGQKATEFLMEKLNYSKTEEHTPEYFNIQLASELVPRESV